MACLMEESSPGFVANHFDVVPIWTNDESRIVVRVVVWAQTWRAIIVTSRLQSRAVESFHLLTILSGERKVKVRRFLLGFVQAQRGLALWAKLDTVCRRPLRDNGYSERFECFEEERFARRIVADSEFDVVKHQFSLIVKPCLRVSRLNFVLDVNAMSASAARWLLKNWSGQITRSVNYPCDHLRPAPF